VTGAVVEGSTTVEYETCVSKAHKTVLERTPTNNETSLGGDFNDWIADQGIIMDSMKRTPQEELNETSQEELNETPHSSGYRWKSTGGFRRKSSSSDRLRGA